MDKKEEEYMKLEKLSKIQNDLEELQDCFLDIKDILDSEKKKSSEREDNVIYIAPFIVREFETVKEIPLSAEEVVSLYLEWAEKLYIIAALNKGSYRNKVINNHIRNLFSLLKTIEKIFVKTDK